jgi:hypothetical protein
LHKKLEEKFELIATSFLKEFYKKPSFKEQNAKAVNLYSF